ncbi:hypothetical protein GCM10008967_07400 [Bacillus carboniphilus]|uniref:Peptidase n=1 Tax=Bacillus carboniphilus TaxID=86663 RepID=A0ABN0VX24_9BACI
MSFELSLKSVVDCRHLSVQPDGDEFSVGDPYLGEFIRVPEVAVDVVRLFDGRRTVEDVHRLMLEKYEEEVDVLDFAVTLLECDLIYSVDGAVVHPEVRREASEGLYRLGRFFYSRVMMGVYVVAAVVAVVMMVMRPELFPAFRDVFVYESVGFSALNILVVTAALTVLHEVGHLLAASACRVNSRIRLNLRLIFLVAETDMTGLWGVEKKKRYVPFMAGMMWDGLVIAVCLGVQWFGVGGPVVEAYAAMVVFICMMNVLWQFVVFFRTDLYFVLSNWKNTSALHQHSMLYLRRRVLGKQEDAWDELPEHERKNATWFGMLYGVGAVVAIGVFAYFQIPPLVYGVNLAVGNMIGHPVGSFVFWDGAIVLMVLAVNGVLWLLGLRTNVRERRRMREQQGAVA